MALQGTLKDFSLADIFQLIGLQKKTGLLTLKSAEETVTVSFVDGNVVSAEAAGKRLEDRLGAVLAKTGQITDVQLQEALKIQKQTLRRLGSVLVEKKYVSAEALREALRIQVSQMIYRLFRWRDGDYHFSQEARIDYDREHGVLLSAESVLMEGARILDEWPMIEKRLGPLSGVFRRTAAGEGAVGGPASRPTIVLSAEERVVLQGVDGKRTIHDLVGACPFSEFDTCRILYELAGRELVEKGAEAAGPAPPRPVVRPKRAREVGDRPPMAGKLALLALAALSFATAARNPFNGLTVLAGRHPAEARFLQQASRTRMERIRYSLRVYYLQNRGFPKDLNYLTVSGLLRPQDLRDPWQREYGYRPLAGGFELQGMDGSGAPDPDLTIRSTLGS